MSISKLVDRLLELDREELEEVLQSTKEHNEEFIEILEESLEEL